MKYYIMQIKTANIIKNKEGEYEEVSIYGDYISKPKSLDQMIESLKTFIVNELYLATNSGKYNSIIVHPNLCTDNGCVITANYFVASAISRRIDRVYLKTTNIKDVKYSSPIEWSEYKLIWKEIKPFVKVLEKEGDDKICIM